MRKISDGTLLAVKTLKKVTDPKKMYKEVMNEIKATMAGQTLEGFPKFHGIINEGSFAMEFVGDPIAFTSSSVHSFMLDRSGLSSLERARISTEIARALMAFHRLGWIHNDLHNGNALIYLDPETNKQKAKIIDLGKASLIGNPPPPHCFSAKTKKFFYKNCQQVPPEVVEGTCRCSENSDVYSFGVLLKDIVLNIKELKYIKNLAKRCCHKNPGKRPTIQAVVGELEIFNVKLRSKQLKKAASKNRTKS